MCIDKLVGNFNEFLLFCRKQNNHNAKTKLRKIGNKDFMFLSSFRGIKKIEEREKTLHEDRSNLQSSRKSRSH